MMHCCNTPLRTRKTKHFDLQRWAKRNLHNCGSHTCQLSRFSRETPDFENFSRSPDLNQKSPDLAQDFLNLKINQFFEKLINFVRKSFFLKGKGHTSIPASTDFIFFKSLDSKINV